MRTQTSNRATVVSARPTTRSVVTQVGRPAVWNYQAALLAPCVLFLRSDLGITLNGATVSAWADQSGAGNNVSEGTGANQPNYLTGGLANWPKVNTVTANSKRLSRTPLDLFTTLPYTMAVLASCADSAANKTICAMEGSAGGTSLRKDTANKHNVVHPNVGAGVGAVMGTSVQVLIARFPAAAATLATNGTSEALTGAPATLLAAPVANGAIVIGAEWNGSAFSLFSSLDVYQVAYYTASVSDAIVRQLSALWGNSVGVLPS